LSRSIISRTIDYDQAFVTSYIKYGESDAIVRLFTRKHGRLSAFCKRAFKPSKARGGNLQAPSLAQVGLLFKNSREKSTGLANLVKLDISPRIFVISQNIKSYAWFCYLCEIVEVFLPEHENYSYIYRLLEQSLNLVSERDATLLRAFELKLLDTCGYLPDLANISESKPTAQINTDILPGGIESSIESEILSFDLVARELALELLEKDLGEVKNISIARLKMVGRIFRSYLKLIRATPLKSVAFLKELA